MTLAELINELLAIQAKTGGDVQVVVDDGEWLYIPGSAVVGSGSVVVDDLGDVRLVVSKG